MNILHINSYFATSGLFKHLYDRQKAQQLNIEVYVPMSYQFDTNKIAANGDYTTVQRNHHIWERYIFYMKHYHILSQLKKTYDMNNFDLIHAHSLFSNGWLAYQLYRTYQIPYVVAVRSSDVRTFFGKLPLLRPVGINILKNASQIVFISQNTYNETFERYIPKKYNALFKQKSQVISNGIDPFWFDERFEKKTKLSNNPIQLISVAKTLPEKRLVPLAEMVTRYNETHEQQLQCHIVGPNWNQTIVNQLLQFKDVIYHESMDKHTLLEMYRKMDIFALLSRKETFGLVYPEAMSQSLPVIYSKNEGFDSYFPNHSVGVSVDKNSQAEFDDAIQFIIEHYEQLSKTAYQSIERFDWDEVTQQYDQIYREVVK